MSETGMATTGTSTERSEPRNRKMTIDDDEQGLGRASAPPRVMASWM